MNFLEADGVLHVATSLFPVTMELGSESQEDEPAQWKRWHRREKAPRPRMLT